MQISLIHYITILKIKDKNVKNINNSQKIIAVKTKQTSFFSYIQLFNFLISIFNKKKKYEIEHLFYEQSNGKRNNEIYYLDKNNNIMQTLSAGKNHLAYIVNGNLYV